MNAMIAVSIVLIAHHVDKKKIVGAKVHSLWVKRCEDILSERCRDSRDYLRSALRVGTCKYCIQQAIYEKQSRE